MKITVRPIPQSITSFTFSPRKILSDNDTLIYLEETFSDILNDEICDAARKLEIDVFDLIFLNGEPFADQWQKYRSVINKENGDLIKTALLIRKMYNGNEVCLSKAFCANGHAFIDDPVYCYLNVASDRSEKNRKNITKRKKLENIKPVLSERSAGTLEAIRLSAMRYGMKEALAYKELIDKFNIRRFTSGLKLNNRPADIEEINEVLAEMKDKSYADLTKTSVRIRYCVLFVLAYSSYTIDDIYAKNCVFSEEKIKEKSLAELSSNFINIISNGNGIEIAHTYIKMINAFTEIEPPDVDMTDLSSVMDNYTLYYACAALAIECENIFRLNNDLKIYMKTHNIYNYWHHVEKVILMKQYIDIISFCNTMSRFNVDAYKKDQTYKDEILFAFEKAFRFSKKIKEERKNINFNSDIKKDIIEKPEKPEEENVVFSGNGNIQDEY